MVWSSVFIMTIIDLLIVGFAGYAMFLVPRQWQAVSANALHTSQILVVTGLGLFTLFHLADLVVMHVLPHFMSTPEVRDIMAYLHLEYYWWVALVVIACISISFVILARSTSRLFEALKTSEAALVVEIAQHAKTEQERGVIDQRLRAIVNAVPVGISYLDREQRFQFLNRNYENLFGRSLKKLMGRTLVEAIGEEAYEIAEKYTRRALNGERVSFENTLPDSGRGQISIFVTYVPDIGSNSAVRGFYTFVQDITEHKRLQGELRKANEELELRVEELKNSEKRFRDFADLGTDWLWEMDENLRFKYMSPNIVQLGVEKEFFIGKTLEETRHDNYDLDDLDEELRALKAQKRYRGERPSVSTPGRWLQISGRPLVSENGAFMGYRGATTDITERKISEKRNKESHHRLLESTNAIPWEADAKTWLFTYIGPQAEELLGYPPEQWLEEDFWVDHMHASDRMWAPDYCLNASKELEHYEFEYRMIGSGGQTVWLQDIVNVIRDNGEPVALRGFVIEITERKRAEETLQKLNARLINAHEEERRRIARELHDDFGQNLAILTVDLEVFRNQLSDPEISLSNFLESQIRHAKDLSSKLQSLSRQLHPSIIEHIGLVSAISAFCGDLSDRHDIEIELTHNDVSRALSSDVSLCLYRVLQEALRNVIKHSGAQTVLVELHQTGKGVALRISDNGKGFDPTSDQAYRGLGLLSMRERLRIVDGEFAVTQIDPNGTQIKVWVPLRDFDPALRLRSTSTTSGRNES